MALPPARGKRGEREPARAEFPWLPPSWRPGFPARELPRAARGSQVWGAFARAGWKVPRRRRRRRRGLWGKVESGRRWGGNAEAGSAFRSPRYAARPWWRPGVRPTAAPRGPDPLPSAAGHAPPGPRRPARRARVWGRRPAPRPARPCLRPRSRGCVPRAVTRGTPRRRPPSRACLRVAAASCRAGPRPGLPRRGGVVPPRPRARPPPAAGGRAGRVAGCGVRPVPGSCSSLRPPRCGGAAGAPSAAAPSRRSPRRARHPTEPCGWVGWVAGGPAAASARPLPRPFASSSPRRDLRSDVATR